MGSNLIEVVYVRPYEVDPCHHGVTRPQVVDGGTASNVEDICEYIE